MDVPVPLRTIFVSLLFAVGVYYPFEIFFLYLQSIGEDVLYILHSRPNIRHMETISESKIRITNDWQSAMPIQNMWMTENVSCRNWNQRKKKRFKWTAFYWQFKIVSIVVAILLQHALLYIGKKKENKKKGKKLFSIEINWNRFDNVLASSIRNFEYQNYFLINCCFRFPSFSFQMAFDFVCFTWIPSSDYMIYQT